jgi:gamma-glutamyl-gamma-aminobutyrate hydrolase PuuD
VSKSSSKKILISPRHCEENHIHKSAGETLISHYLFTYTDFLPIMASLDKGINNREKALHLAENYIEISDALILLGGNDIDPRSYNQTNINCKKTYIFRDYFEMGLIEKALAKGIPIFGICRGFQMVNIYFGGTLLQNLYEIKFLKHSYSDN